MKIAVRRSKAGGFTFIEMIVAVTIFTIIAVSIYSTFHAGIKIWLKTNPMIEVNQSTRLFFNIISSDLKGAIKYTTREDEPNFEGEKQRIAFMTLVDVSGEETPLHKEPARVIYDFKIIEEGKAAKPVIRRSVAAGKEGFDEDKAVPAEIMSGVSEEDFGFEYCYIVGSADNKEYTYQWKDKWEDEDKVNIPRGIKVKAGKFEKTVFVPTGELGGIGK